MTGKLDSQQSWSLARNYANSFGSYTPAFTSTIRTLLLDQTHLKKNGDNRLSEQSSFFLNRLLRCPSILAHFYFATRTIHERDLMDRSSIGLPDLLKLYTPHEMACLLGTIYVTRRLSQRCDPEQWKILVESMQQYSDLGLLLGAALPGIGTSNGLIAAVMRFLAWATFAIRDTEKFRKYRITLKAKKMPYNWNTELSDWGTTHVHVASVILTSLGFGKEFVNSYFMGSSDIAVSFLDEAALRFRVAILWLDSLIYHREPPKDTLADDFTLDENLQDEFADGVTKIIAGESKYFWLLRTKDDVGPEVTPELVLSAPAASSSAALDAAGFDPTDINYQDLDEQIRDNFSESELKDLMTEVKSLVAES